MNRKKDSPIKSMIKESLKELKDNEFPDDPTIEAEEMTGPERFAHGQKRKDEVVIDSLLADISGKAGYFMKLKKEMRPNEWMLMKVIEHDWRQWADIESSIASIVIDHTKKSPTKWGSGAYRLEIACKGGMRGKGYDPMDFWINAEEEFLPNQVNGVSSNPIVSDPSVQVTAQLDMLSQLMNVVRGVIPTPQNPVDVQNQMTTAFREGMQMKVGDSNNSTQMMIAMMTTMMGVMKEIMSVNRNGNETKIVNPDESLTKMLGVMKDFGVIGQNNGQQKSIVDVVKELQVLGIDLLKKDEPLEQINKLKQIANIASDFMGMNNNGERPSIIEKLVDVIGPSVPGILKDIKETATNAVRVQEIAGQNMERAKQLSSPSKLETVGIKDKTTYQQMSNNGNENGSMLEQIQMFFNQLHESVKSGNRTFYPILYTTLMQDVNGQQLLQGILSQIKNTTDVIQLIQQFGDTRFKESEFVIKSLVPYVNGFMLWVRGLTNDNKQQVNNEYEVMCPRCQTVYSYPSEQEYINDPNKSCEVVQNGMKCTGTMEPMKVGNT